MPVVNLIADNRSQTGSLVAFAKKVANLPVSYSDLQERILIPAIVSFCPWS